MNNGENDSSMIYFNWVDINWHFWMPVQIAVVVFLILLLRFLRRQHRWGAVGVSHVHMEEWGLENQSLSCYVKTSPNLDENPFSPKDIPQYNPSDHRSTPKILLFTPLFAITQKKNYLATSLALFGFDVITISSKQIRSLFSSPTKSPLTLKKLIQELHITSIVAFDYAISPVLHIFSNIEESDRNSLTIKWIFLRPTLDWTFIRPLWQFVPFTYQWISRLKLLSYQSWYKSLIQGNNGVILPPSFFKGRMRYLLSQRTWISNVHDLEQQRWMDDTLTAPQLHQIHFTHGNWTFFRNETVVLGYLAQFLHES